MLKKIIALLVAVVAVFVFAGCDDSTVGKAQQAEDKSRQSNYEKLTKSQPAHTMNYSPTREAKNFWIDTWSEKGKLSYIYLRDSQSQVFGYYIFKGLPVNYCTSLVVPYQIVKPEITGDNNVALAVPGPSVDGTFGSSSNCDEWYGQDAVSGAYIEYSTGLGINQQISDQPLPQFGDAEPQGSATIKAVK